jgi:MFS family permease
MSTPIPAVTTAPLPSSEEKTGQLRFIVAWSFCLLFYFLQYALRSAPGVMIPELIAAFGLTALGVSSLLGLYYYTYAGFAIVAGASLDRYGAKLPIAIGVFAVAVGSILFGLGSMGAAESGRLLQGAGSAFAFTGAVFLAARAFSDRWLGTAVGFTQLAGMLGGFAGQHMVGPLVHGTIAWQSFWIYSGVLAAIIGLGVLIVTPTSQQAESGSGSLWSILAPYKVVLTNPQSYLCGVIGGLMFMPTTIGDMIWGVPFGHEGLGLAAAEATARSSMVPLGWVIGAPLLGYIADRTGRRKPMLIVGLLIMLLSLLGIVYFPGNIPPYAGGLLFGIGSGAAMIPYAMIKEVNPDRVKGSATGAMNFLVFSLSAVVAPVFGLTLRNLSHGRALTLATFQKADLLWLAAVVISLVLTLFLRETGARARGAPPVEQPRGRS